MSRKRWTLLLALGLVTGAVFWIAAHPELLTPYFARLATRHLLRDSEGDLRIGSFSGNVLTGLQLYDVTLSLQGERGAAVDVGIDTLSVDYRFSELLQSPLRLRRVVVSGADCRARRGGAPEPAAKIRPGSPFTLPRFRIDDLDVYGSSMTVSGPQGRIEETLDGVRWRGTVKADTSLTLVCQRGDLRWESRDSMIRDLRGLLTVDSRRIDARHISFVLNDHAVTASGHRTHDGDLSLRIAADGISTYEIEELIDTTLGFSAAGGTRMQLSTRADSLWLDISFQGEFEGYDLEGMQGTCLLADDVLAWDRLEGRINGAWFSVSGTFDLHDARDVSFQLRGDVSDVDLARGLVPDLALPETDGWGWLNLWRRDGTDQTRVSGWLREGHLAGVPFDSVHVSLEGDGAGVTFHSLELRHAAQTAHLTGYADTSGAFLGRLEILAGDLATLPRAWPVPTLQGALQVSGTLSGQDPVYDFEGVAAIASCEIGPVRIDDVRADLSVENILGAPEVSAELAGRSLRCAGVELGSFTTGGVATSQAAVLHHFRSQHGDTTLSFRGQVEYGPDGASYYLPRLEFMLEGNSWQLADAVRFRTGDGFFRLEQASLVSDWGALHGFAVWDEPGDNLDGEVVLDHVDLDLVNSFLTAGASLNGELTATLSLGGTPYEPLLGLEARLDDCVLPLATIDSLTVAALFYDDNLDIRSLDLHSDFGRVEVSGLVSHSGVDPEEFWPGAELVLHLDITDGDWAFIDQFGIPSLDRIAGTFDGSLDLGGTTYRPVIAGGITSTPFDVHWLHLDELRGSLGYADGQLTLGGLRGHRGNLALTGRIEVPLELDLHTEPVSPLDGPFYMRVSIPRDSDLTDLARICNAFVETGGRGGLDLVVSGKAEHPYYSGSVEARGASCVIRGLSEVYRDISCDGSWQGDVLTLTDIRGHEGERGVLAGSGTMTFAGLELEGFDVRLSADRFLVASIPELRALVRSDEVALTSVKVGPDSLIVPRFTGNLEVIEARYVGDFSEQPSLSDPRVGTVAPDWLADLNLRAPRSSGRIVNRTMELDLGGDVRLVRDLDGMYLRGTMAIDRGHLPVFNNDFKVTRGNLDFSQEVGVIPTIDMTAETSVRLPASDGGTRRLEKIWVEVTGSAMTPVVDFSSESGYARSNIERMLLGLSPHATDTQTNSAIRQGTMAAGFNLLEREVAAELDLVDTFDIESGRVREDGTTQTLIGVGKYIGRDLYVKFAQAVTDQDREVLVEYQI
ncbi:translocation/assembly module TamB, partial [bacterium]|nr:translocation/assembly module TamB [bacterium]